MNAGGGDLDKLVGQRGEVGAEVDRRFERDQFAFAGFDADAADDLIANDSADQFWNTWRQDMRAQIEELRGTGTMCISELATVY